MSDKCTCLLLKGRKSCRLESWRAELARKELRKADATAAKIAIGYLVWQCSKYAETMKPL